MAADDRKKRILDHLARSSDNLKLVSPKRTSQPAPATAPAPPPPPASKAEVRKQTIMIHLERSGGSPKNFSLSSQQRKSQILNHVRQSQG
ncbi:MAG: hypothetical protein SVX43_06385 [Cyanobacteriota bacterium]|nr:hypothetical protein [Cyanobacteriota bacterium]